MSPTFIDNFYLRLGNSWGIFAEHDKIYQSVVVANQKEEEV